MTRKQQAEARALAEEIVWQRLVDAVLDAKQALADTAAVVVEVSKRWEPAHVAGDVPPALQQEWDEANGAFRAAAADLDRARKAMKAPADIDPALADDADAVALVRRRQKERLMKAAG